ncbi:Rrf2 family transcriptional regulator [Thalassobaculum sp.]|uniref:RrF2 family transcriptional regulator n=1 Tax=Thalassobaculum sp. TaxID=2022740 RepID=UPI0032EAA0AA
MQLSQFTDYALRTLILVALNGDRRTTIDEIATRYGISKEHLRKVVHLLSRLGILQSTRGKNGGLRLNITPETLRIGDIVRATEGGFAMAECLRADQAGQCPIDGVCRLSGILRGATTAFLAELDRHTLAELVAERDSLLRRLTARPVSETTRQALNPP